MTAPLRWRLLVAGVLFSLAACVTESTDGTSPQWELTGESPSVIFGEVLEEALPVAGDLVASSDEDDTEVQDLTTLLGDPATEADVEPDFLADQPPSPFHRLGHSVIRGMDGSWSKTYTLQTGQLEPVLALLRAHVTGFPTEENTPAPLGGAPTEIIKYVSHSKLLTSSKETVGIRPILTDPHIGDLLVVTAPPETLLFIDEVLHRILGDLPQIELEVRVVEINIDDLVDYDAKIFFSDLENPGLPYDENTNPPDGNFGDGLPIQDDGADTGAGAGFSSFGSTPSLPGFLLSLQGVHNGLTVDAIISLLQSVGAAELISSPTVTVLNGHPATLNTGTRIPTFEATGVGNNPSIVTKYQDTGVQVDILPFIVSESEGLIRIELSIDVTAVTQNVTFQIAGTDVLNPIISTRQAGTTVHVYSGQVFALAGLKSSEKIETITKVPLLGDIPVLGWLFKSQASQTKNTEILFFVTPRIKIPSEGLIRPLDG